MYKSVRQIPKKKKKKTWDLIQQISPPNSIYQKKDIQKLEIRSVYLTD